MSVIFLHTSVLNILSLKYSVYVVVVVKKDVCFELLQLVC